MRGHYVHRTWQHDPARYAPPTYRRACSYDAFVPDRIADLGLTLPGDLAGVLSEAEKAVADLNRVGGPELRPLARLLLRAEAIASSKLEGLQVDARALGRAEVRRAAGRHVDPEVAEILANIDATELAVEQAASTEGIQPGDLLAVHRTLLADEPDVRRPGEFRHGQNWIGGNDYNPCGAAFVPPPPEEVEGLIADLCRFCSQQLLPPLLQAAIAHAQFETIHPFVDGNGRTGRALIQLILRRRGLAPALVVPVSIALSRQRNRYIGGLTAFREDRLGEWVLTFASATAAAAQLAERFIGSVRDLQGEWRQRLRERSNPRSDAAAWALINVLPAHPMVTVPIAVIATGRTRPAVTNGIFELERAGVLTPLTAQRRNRIWEADGLLDLLARLECGDG